MVKRHQQPIPLCFWVPALHTAGPTVADDVVIAQRTCDVQDCQRLFEGLTPDLPHNTVAYTPPTPHACLKSTVNGNSGTPLKLNE